MEAIYSCCPHEISVEPRQRENKVKRWEGQRPRCPCNDESGSGNAAPPGVAVKRPMTKTKHRMKKLVVRRRLAGSIEKRWPRRGRPTILE